MLVLLATHIQLAFKVGDKGGEGIEMRYYFLLLGEGRDRDIHHQH